jgi:hypothetical protein
VRRAGIVGLAIALVVALATIAVPAVGDVNYPRIKTKVVFGGIEVDGDQATFFGKLKSRKHACEKRRRGLYVHFVGDTGVVGNDRTDRKGRWEFTREVAGLEDGEYDATIPRAEIRKGDRKFVCRPGRGTFVTDAF